MFRVRIHLAPTGGWDTIKKELQYSVARDDLIPYMLHVGDGYNFELSNKDLVGGTVNRTEYYRNDKSTEIHVDILPHLWDPDKFIEAGWQNS